MKILNDTSIKKLMQLIKSSFISNDDTVEADELTIDTAPTASSSNLVTSGGVYTAISDKVDKITGKGLSTNDYTTAEQTKLAGIAAGAEVNVNADWNAVSGDAQILNKPTIPTVPTNVSAFTNDAGYTTNTGTVTSVAVKMNGATKGTVTTSGSIDLGTVITAHQDISGKEDVGKITISGTAYTAGKHTLSWTNSGTTYSYEVVTV